MSKLLFTVLFSLGILFGILFIWFTYFYKKRRDVTFNKLTLFLLTFTLNNIQILLVDNFVDNQNCYLKNLHPFLFFVFVVPYFHSFIVNYLKIDKIVHNYIKVATLFFLVGMVFRILIVPFVFNLDCKMIGCYVKVEEILIAIFSMYVFLKVVQIVYFQENLYLDKLSFDKLKWIKTFLFYGLLVLLFWIFAIVSNLKNYVNLEIYFYYPLRISSSLLIYWVAYTASFQNVLTSDRENIRKKLKINPKAILFDVKIETEPSDKFKTICDFFEKTECFLNPNFSLDQLSEQIKINRTSLSEEINKNAKQNFNDFVNSFRVSKSKLLLKDSEYENYTIDAIGLECGFNSKSTFYSAFKKVTNTTPAAFRQINY